MDIYHAIIIVLLILILWWVWKKCGSAVVEGLTIPNSAGPVSKPEIIRLLKGGIPLSQDQFLMHVPAGSMARLGTFNPDSPTSTEGFSSEGFSAEGFATTTGTDVTSTDLQRQLFTGISAANSYTVKPQGYTVKPQGYTVKPQGYTVKPSADGYLVRGLADGLQLREKPDAFVIRGGSVVMNPYAMQNARGPSIPMKG